MGLDNYDDDLNYFEKLQLYNYEKFLDHIVVDLGIDLSYSVKLKNINFYKTILKSLKNKDFINQVK